MNDSPVPIEELLAHRDWLTRLARDLFGAGRGAQDAVQETWLAALRRPPRLRTGLKGWLATVLRNRFRNACRSEKRRRVRERDVARPEPTEDASALAERIELERRVSRWVLDLPEPGRNAVILHYYSGRTPAEIARELGEPAGTVRSRLTRARELLRSRAREGSGRDGLLALAPLLTPWVTRSGTTTASHTATALTLGAIGMSVKAKIGIIAACLLLLGGAIVLIPDSTPPESEKTVARSVEPTPPPPPPPSPPTEPAATETPAEPSPPAPTLTGAEIEARLDREIEHFELEDVPALRAIGIVAATVRLPLALTREAALALEKRPPIQLQLLRPVPARTVVSLVAAITGLEWNVEDSRIVLGVAGQERDRSASLVVPPHVELDPHAPDVLTVQGRVLDEEGRIRPGATVEILRGLDHSPELAGQADDRGDFEIEVRRPYPRVLARADGRIASFAREVEGAYGHVFRLDLRLRGPAGRVEGRVLDPDGAAVREARVRVSLVVGRARHAERVAADGTPCTELRVWRTVTDGQGRFRVDSLPPGKVRLVGSAEGLGATWATGEVTAGQTTHVDIALVTPVIVTGRVTDARGRPVAGAVVSAVQGVAGTVTSEDGSYRLATASVDGAVMLGATAPGFQPALHRIEVRPGGAVTWDPRLERAR